jgi:catechol 2,3-dioxygenase-like lactoylglutathione lyase family enzyme
MLPPMIGRPEKTVFDCPDPRALAAFYAQVLGMRVNEDEEDWVVIGRVPGARELAFQRVTTWVPPRWPDPRFPQQLHLDIRVDDVDAAERVVLELGARRFPAEREEDSASSRAYATCGRSDGLVPTARPPITST